MPWLLVGGAVVLAGILWWFVRSGDRASTAEADAQAGDTASEDPGRSSGDGGVGADELAPTRASGQVRAITGEAIAGAVVTLAPLGDGDDGPGAPTTASTASTALTDAEGSWSIPAISPGRYALSATAPGYLPGRLPELTLQPKSDNAGLDLKLEPGGNTLSGTVSDKTGGVIEGALIQVTPSSGILRLRERESYFTLTDERGRYAVQAPDGRHRVRASHPDYTSESIVVELANAAIEQNFSLVPSAVIAGVVVRERDGAPVPGARVEWARERMTILPGGGRISTRDRGGVTIADGQGRFRIGALPPGMIGLTARASQLASAAPLEVPVGIAERVDDVELIVGEAGDVAGRVVVAGDPDRGIEGARVELLSELGPGPSTSTDAEGRFRILGVTPGRYGTLAMADGFSPPAGPRPTIEVGDGPTTSLVLELEHGRSIVGRVEPPTHAEVAIELDPNTVQMGGGGMLMLSAAGSTHSSASTGAFELGPVEPGTYTLEARAADGRGGSVEVVVGQDGAEDVVIALEQRAILTGHVEDFSGKLLDDVTVRARKRRTGHSLSVVVNGRELTAHGSPTTTEGRFEIAGLAEGPWIVEVVDAQGDPLAMATGDSLDVEIQKAETKQLVLRVEPRDGTIAGTVRDAEGEVVPDVWVSAAFVPELGDRDGPERGDAGEDEPGVHSEMRMIVATDDDSSTLRTLPPVLTDEQGRFEFTELRRGDYTLTAEFEGGTSKATLDNVRPDAEVTLELAPLGAVEGRVTSNGEPANCIARIFGPSERAVKVRDGTFRADRLEPGRYTIEASAGDGSTSQTVTIEAGRTADVELALERFATITGVIVDETGAPIPNAEILIGSGEGGRVEITRDGSEPQIFCKQDGSFETRAAAGNRVLLAQMPGVPMPFVIHPFVVTAGQDLDLGTLKKKQMDGMMMGEPGEDGGPPPE